MTKEARVSAPALYWHLTDKEALMVAVRGGIDESPRQRHFQILVTEPGAFTPSNAVFTLIP